MEEIDKMIENDEVLQLSHKIVVDSNDVSNLFLKFIEHETEYIKLYHNGKADMDFYNLYRHKKDLMLSDARVKIKGMLEIIDEMDWV